MLQGNSLVYRRTTQVTTVVVIFSILLGGVTYVKTDSFPDAVLRVSGFIISVTFIWHWIYFLLGLPDSEVYSIMTPVRMPWVPIFFLAIQLLNELLLVSFLVVRSKWPFWPYVLFVLVGGLALVFNVWLPYKIRLARLGSSILSAHYLELRDVFYGILREDPPVFDELSRGEKEVEAHRVFEFLAILKQQGAFQYFLISPARSDWVVIVVTLLYSLIDFLVQVASNYASRS